MDPESEELICLDAVDVGAFFLPEDLPLLLLLAVGLFFPFEEAGVASCLDSDNGALCLDAFGGIDVLKLLEFAADLDVVFLAEDLPLLLLLLMEDLFFFPFEDTGAGC